MSLHIGSIYDLWIGLLIGLSLASLVWVLGLRRHGRNLATIHSAAREIERATEEQRKAILMLEEKAKELELTKQVLRNTISDIYHKEIFPEICRIEGVYNVLDTYIEEAKSNCEVAGRSAEHFQYNKLIADNIKEMKAWVGRGKAEQNRLRVRFETIMQQAQIHQE